MWRLTRTLAQRVALFAFAAGVTAGILVLTSSSSDPGVVQSGTVTRLPSAPARLFQIDKVEYRRFVSRVVPFARHQYTFASCGHGMNAIAGGYLPGNGRLQVFGSLPWNVKRGPHGGANAWAVFVSNPDGVSYPLTVYVICDKPASIAISY